MSEFRNYSLAYSIFIKIIFKGKHKQQETRVE